jgi:Resolvase, N terminal domain
MRVAAYARVSTDRQQLAQTIQQQVELLRAYVRRQPEWVLDEAHIFRDDGYSGARRPPERRRSDQPPGVQRLPVPGAAGCPAVRRGAARHGPLRPGPPARRPGLG